MPFHFRGFVAQFPLSGTFGHHLLVGQNLWRGESDVIAGLARSVMMCAMQLYQRWRETVERNADQWALCDAGRVWTFGDLHQAVTDRAPMDGPALLRGRTAEFVLSTLQAWRDRQIAVPVEEGAVFELANAQLDRVPSEVVHVKTTSGSTGNPRHVLFSAGQLAADAAQIVSTMRLRPDWPNLGVVSLAHSYGFSNLVLPLLLHGIPLILVPDPLPETMRRALSECESDGVTIAAVPALWRTWSLAGVLNTDQVKLAISAGAPLPIDLERAVFDSCGVKIHNFLGATECGGIAYDRTDTPREHGTQWIGSALDGVSLSVDASGVLCVKTAAAGHGYWPTADASLSAGEFRTSDLARLEQGKEVHLLGRADDVINVSGRKVHPSEIEQLLNAQSGVLHSVVFGIPSTQIGRNDDITAIVCLEDGTEIASIKRAVAGLLPVWKVPRRWGVDRDLRPDRRGKISRARWRNRYLDQI